MKKTNLKTLTAAAASFAAGMLLCMGLVVWRLGGFSLFPSVLKYAAALRLVQRDYIGEADPVEMTDTALSAAIATLDRWSYYMTAEEYDDYLDYSNNRYQGIGVTVAKDEKSGGFEVLDLTVNGPAALAGVQIGEIITACDGVDVTGGTTAELKAAIQAGFGGEVTLTLLAPDGTERELAVSCETIRTDPVLWERMDDGYGLIRITNFEAGMAESAIAAVDALMEQGVEGIVFDVRSNPGGRVSELCELLDYLLPEGDLFIRADKNGREVVERSDSAYADIPLAVLVNADSYSAAEFFAAALQEYGRAVVAGEATTGKGRSQLTYVLSDGSAVHMSCYVYLTPQRVDLSQTGGITPDVTQELDDGQRTLFAAGELAPADDPQIQAAVAALRS